MSNASELSSLAALRILLLGLISFLPDSLVLGLLLSQVSTEQILILEPTLLTSRSYLNSTTNMDQSCESIPTNFTSVISMLTTSKQSHLVFKVGTKFHKDPSRYSNTGLGPSIHLFSTLETKQAVAHKSMFTPFFSPEAIRRVEPLIQDFVNKFMDKMHTAASSGNVVNLSQGFRCLTADVIMNYSFQRPLGALEASDFEFPLLNALDGFAHTIQWRLYFPNAVEALFQIIQVLPAKMMAGFMEPLRSTQECLSFCRNRILDLKKRSPSPLSNVPTVFDIMLNPNTSKGQWTPELPTLTSDALMLLLAGTNTTAHTLVVAVYNLIHSPHLVQRLVAELRGAMSEPCSQNDWANLEKLPYLRAVVKESLRLSYGAPGPLPRVVPPTGAFLAGQHIPPGTVVSLSNLVYNHDPRVFENPTQFRPERWLSGTTSEMERHMVSFSRGSRICLGMDLAYAELYLTLGHLFRRYQLELSGVTSADMEWDDMLVPITRGTLRVHVKESTM
ncbi:MAG: hypothetical protein ALECFALPRED_009236 [Alectoria fallacina]|uniref:Cytochrome P450 n=1 Tax=Alectoria fallacina TaxID=1903189 RepID=A0A8H3J6K3_9LECA|nr:MAG: hypothetical protein ALECFALPRED_009236 [Alectoria fallacina]